jgi:hypothetical protein
MLDSASEKEIALFFDGFVEAFSTFDGTAVGRLFVAPGVALSEMERYRASGCRSCHYSNLETHFLNDKTVIATASWDLLHQNGSVISRWRQAYFLSRFGREWRIFGSAFVSE